MSRPPDLGPFGDYLTGPYLRGEPYRVPGALPAPAQLHETARTGGRYVHLEGGIPAHDRRWIRELDRSACGFSAGEVAVALEAVLAYYPQGRAILAWYQAPPGERPAIAAVATEAGLHPDSLRRQVRRIAHDVLAVLLEADRRGEAVTPPAPGGRRACSLTL